MGYPTKVVVRLTDGTRYDSIRAAARANGISPSSISIAMLRDGTAGGHRWAVPAPPEPERQRFDVERFVTELDVYLRWHAKGAISTEDAWTAVQHLWRKSHAQTYVETLKEAPDASRSLC